MPDSSRQTLPLQRLADHIGSHKPFDAAIGDEAVDYVRLNGPHVPVDDIVAILRVLAPRLDWARYEWEQTQLAAGIPSDELASRHQSLTEHQHKHVRALVEELRPALNEARNVAERISFDRRDFESFLGFDQNLIVEVVDTLGPIVDRKGWPDIAELISDAFCPASSGTYCREYHGLIRQILRALPRSHRANHTLVRVVGESLARCTCRGRRASLLRLRQTYLLAKDRLKADRTNVLACVWALEVSLWQRANRVRRRFSVSKLLDHLWTVLPQTDNLQLSNALALLHSIRLLEEPDVRRRYGWEELATPGEYGHVDQLYVRFPIERGERLALALISLASRAKQVDATILAQIAGSEVAAAATEAPSQLQSRQLVWLSEYARLNESYLAHLYDPCWESALRRGDDAAVRLNAIAVLLTSRLLLRIVPNRHLGITVLLAEVAAICNQHDEHRNQAAQIIAGCQVFLERLMPQEPEFLSQFEIDAIRQAGQTIPWEGVGELARERVRPFFEDALAKDAFAEAELRRELGSSLWDSLQASTKAQFKRGYISYHSERILGEDYFNFAISGFALGLQSECAHCIWKPLCTLHELKRELMNCSVMWPKPHERQPSLAFYHHVFLRCYRGSAPKTKLWLSKQTKSYDELVRVAGNLLNDMSKQRSAAVHEAKFARHEAEMICDKLFRRNMLRDFLRALQCGQQ